MKTTPLIALLFTGIALTAYAQSGDDVETRPQETELSTFADEFGAGGYTSTDGEVLYQTLCAGCHMPDGGGAVGAGEYPALRDNPRMEFASYPVFIIVNGQGAMPGFGSMLSDEQIAAITSFVQSNLGNGFEPDVTPEMVADNRPAEEADMDTEEHE